MMRAISTLGPVGHMRPAPGTWGSLAALPLAWVAMLGGPWVFVAATLAVVAVGFPAARAEVAASGAHDPSQVVIDEVAGQWIALWPVAFGAWAVGMPVLALWPGWIGAFVLFRLFDVWKPGPVGWADRRGDVTGLMLDDVIAGVLAGGGVVILGGAAHGLMRAL